MTLILNGFRVDHRIESLMRRDDWVAKRTHPTWLARFPVHAENAGTPLVQFLSIAAAKNTNGGIQHNRFLELFSMGRRDDLYLNGTPSSEFPPGDFDSWNGYLIGHTDACDAGIFVDLRPREPRIIYDTLDPKCVTHATAFSSIDEFVDFCEANLGLVNRLS